MAERLLNKVKEELDTKCENIYENKTVNPSFDIGKLKSRCLIDIDRFYTANEITSKNQNKIENKELIIGINIYTTILKLRNDIINIKDDIENITDLIDNIKDIKDIKDDIVYYISGSSDLNKFDYLTYVSQLNNVEQQNIFWILRTILFMYYLCM
jgi:hypothetical protein